MTDELMSELFVKVLSAEMLFKMYDQLLLKTYTAWQEAGQPTEASIGDDIDAEVAALDMIKEELLSRINKKLD